MRETGVEMLIDDSGFTDKDSKRPEYRELYEKTDNYIAAYSAHTDLRIKNDGPALAIGGQWDEHGPLQLEFLKSKGLTPESHLLDFGCGTGRFARHVVPFLKPGRYVGIDISKGALNHARNLAAEESWGKSLPHFAHSPDGMLLPYLQDFEFQFVWAHSVFTHLPPEIIQAVLKDLSQMEFGAFFYTYKQRLMPLRTGLKQYGYPPGWFMIEAKKVGLVARPLGTKWPQGQSCMVIFRG